MKIIVLLLLCTATANDKQWVSNMLKFGRDSDRAIVASKLYKAQDKDDNNIKYWRVTTSVAQLQRIGVDLSKYTKAKIDAAKIANMNNPDHLIVLVGTNDWTELIATENLEPEPDGDPWVYEQ